MPSFPGMARSRTEVIMQSHKVNVADSSSSPSKLPQPPSSSTPTRALLRRIQRRSSTSTETVIAHASSMHKASSMTMSAAALKRTPQSSTPASRMPISTSRPSTLQRRGSSASLASLSTASRHTRTGSNATLKTMTTTTPSSVVKVTAPAQKASDGKSAVAVVRKADVACKPRTSVPPLPPSVEQGKKVHLVLASLTMPSLVPVTPTTTNVHRKPFAPPPKKRYSMIERTALLRDAGSHQGQGLTQEAASALEQEFAEQERILQGLQRDNERKTVEVEELRRQKAKFEDFCARHFGVDDWHEMVFGVKQPRSPVSLECNLSAQAIKDSPKLNITTKKDDEDLSSVSSSSQAIVESLLKTLQTPLRGRPDVLIAQTPSQTLLDDKLASSPLKVSNDSSRVMSDSFESAVAHTAPNTPNRDEEMLKVPRHLIQSLFDNQQSLLRALSQHV